MWKVTLMCTPEITPVEVSRVSNKFVFIPNRFRPEKEDREALVTSYREYLPTRDAAIERARGYLMAGLDRARQQVEGWEHSSRVFEGRLALIPKEAPRGLPRSSTP